MIRRPPRSTRTDTLFPYTTLFRSHRQLTGAAFEAGRNASLQSDRPAFARPPGLDPAQGTMRACGKFPVATMQSREAAQPVRDLLDAQGPGRVTWIGTARSEEHTSELQSLMRISYAVFCLKKKTNNKRKQTQTKI